VAASDVVNGLLGGTVAVVVAVGDGAVAASAGGPRAMRWNNNTSGFVLRRMAHLASDGNRPDKVFKDKDGSA
jgi:uncharacterized membrane protein